MNSPIAKILLGTGVAAVLGACASFPPAAEPSAERVAEILPGLTQDQVRDLAGTPIQVRKYARAGGSQWTYEYRDAFYNDSEFSVDFDARGIVVSTASQRRDDE